MLHTYYETTLDQIPSLAQEISQGLSGGEVLALEGPLGSGKTTFTQALAKQLRVSTPITSPTFIIMNVTKGILPSRQKKAVKFYHLDIYRCKNFREVEALGITEVWEQPDVITIIEWADKIRKYLPKDTINIKFLGLQ